MLELLDQMQPLEVLFGVPGHVAAGLSSRREKALLNVEVNCLSWQTRGLAEILHAVAPPLVIAVYGFCGCRHAPSTWIWVCVSGRPTQVST